MLELCLCSSLCADICKGFELWSKCVQKVEVIVVTVIAAAPY